MVDDPQKPKIDLTKISTIVTILGSIAALIATGLTIMKDFDSHKAAKASSKPAALQVEVVGQNDEMYFKHLRIRCAGDQKSRAGQTSMDFEIKVQKTMPYYLLNTLKMSQKYLYWTSYDVATTCQECTNLGSRSFP